MNKSKLIKKFIDIEVDGINTKDYPDFCDAYISSATAILEDDSMRDATDEELEELTKDQELVSQLVFDRIY